MHVLGVNVSGLHAPWFHTTESHIQSVTLLVLPHINTPNFRPTLVLAETIQQQTDVEPITDVHWNPIQAPTTVNDVITTTITYAAMTHVSDIISSASP